MGLMNELPQIGLTPSDVAKKVVYYTKATQPIVAGYRAIVELTEHYRLGNTNGRRVLTSDVVAVGEDSTTFETKNSMYVLCDPPFEDPMWYPV